MPIFTNYTQDIILRLKRPNTGDALVYDETLQAFTDEIPSEGIGKSKLENGDASLELATDGTLTLATPTSTWNISPGGVINLPAGGGVTINGEDAFEFAVSVGASPPATTKTGKLWYDLESARLYIYYDGNWIDASPRGQSGTAIPNQNGHAGEILTTDGSNLSWSPIDGGNAES